MDFVTLDFETATADRDSPCEIGLTFVKDKQIIETKSWLIKPYYYPDFFPFNISIHGITPEQVKDKPTFIELWETELKDYLQNKFVIAHNAGFDLSVLRKTLDLYKIEYPDLRYSCSYIFSRKVWKDLLSYDLKSLCYFKQISFDHHRAGSDSLACAKLSLKAFEEAGINELDEIPIKLFTTIGSLFEGGYRPSETKRVYHSKDPSSILGDPRKHKPESIFFGATIVFTGTLSSMQRSEAQQVIADIGGINSNSVSKSTDFLIVGQQDYRFVGEDGMSNKQEKAQKILQSGGRIEVISELDFLRNI